MPSACLLSVASCGHLPGAQLGKGKQLGLFTSPLSWAMRRKRKLSFVGLLCDGGAHQAGLQPGCKERSQGMRQQELALTLSALNSVLMAKCTTRIV